MLREFTPLDPNALTREASSNATRVSRRKPASEDETTGSIPSGNGQPATPPATAGLRGYFAR